MKWEEHFQAERMIRFKHLSEKRRDDMLGHSDSNVFVEIHQSMTGFGCFLPPGCKAFW